ncbi:MAG TPA: dual specificity protein phosphatase [Thermoplasmata archaeon]|nr:dual specificity protein phosphatase [Thermoplasmata archaeon]
MSRPKTTAKPRAKKSKTSPSEILPGVFVGGWKDAEKFSGQRVCVLDELPDSEAPTEEHYPIYDDKKDQPIPENLDRVVRFVDTARERGQPVLMFCGHGIRRASLAGAWYLHRHDGVSLDEAYERVKAVRPQIEHVRDWVGNWKLLESTPPARSR